MMDRRTQEHKALGSREAKTLYRLFITSVRKADFLVRRDAPALHEDEAKRHLQALILQNAHSTLILIQSVQLLYEPIL